jgi:DNA-binding winged helix-turn-helix (wHTH) protein
VSRVSFGNFVLDLDSRELRQGSQAVPLTPKAYQLLEILVTNRPKALSKFTLQEQLWPDTFVLEKNLVNLIAEIRQALGDDPTEPRFVRTVHRFGYAFQLPPAETASDNTTMHSTTVRFRLQWANGRARLGEGEHVLGRDPDLELFFDSPGVSRRHALIGWLEIRRRSKISKAKTGRLSPIGVSTLQRNCVTATVSASVQSS